MDMDDRLKRVEVMSKENKDFLKQLVTHTQEVERAVTMNQQEILRKKEAQATK